MWSTSSLWMSAVSSRYSPGRLPWFVCMSLRSLLLLRQAARAETLAGTEAMQAAMMYGTALGLVDPAEVPRRAEGEDAAVGAEDDVAGAVGQHGDADGGGVHGVVGGGVGHRGLLGS